MLGYNRTPCSNAPRIGTLLAATVAVVAIVVTACGGGTADAGPPSGDAANVADPPTGSNDAAQPLDAVVAGVVAPAGGSDTQDLVRAMAWAGGVFEEECGAATFMRETDRYDQATFADMERIQRDGIGVLESFDNPLEDPMPVPVEDAAGPQCMVSAFPEWMDGQAVFSQWMDTVVYPIWQSGDVEAAKADVVSCLADELGSSVSSFTTLDGFFGSLTGQITHWTDLPAGEQRSRIAAYDATVTQAFIECSSDFYASWEQKLDSERGPFLERHHEAVDALASAMDRRGYVP